MAKFFQGGADRACGLCFEEECTKFSLGSTGNNLVHDLLQDMNGAIIWWCQISGHGCRVLVGAEEVVPSSAGSTFGG